MFRSQSEVLRHVSKDKSQARENSPYHLPQFVGSWQLDASSLKNERLLVQASMPEFEIQISKPVLDVSWIAKDILLIDGVFLGLVCFSHSAGDHKAGSKLTIRYISGWLTDSLGFIVR